MQDRPEAHELLEALAGWLGGELAQRLPREERFGARVAANVAAIVAREIEPGAPGEAIERERMERLLRLAGEQGGGEHEARALQRRAASAIRAGCLDEHWDEAVAIVRASVRDKLAVARPGYDSFEEPPA